MSDSCLEKTIANFEDKILTLENVRKLNKNLRDNFSDSGAFDEKRYDEIMTDKSDLIERIASLNEEADRLYESFSSEMKTGMIQSEKGMSNLREKIEKLNFLTKETENDEKEIKNLMERFFSAEREKIKAAHKNSGAAINYYQTMSASKNVQSMFYDSRSGV
ncbi:MAG: hypothetical protein K5894_03405 [Lachnospiraceae bacterium]|nr:hypothetical protein [Lachnospiraceae bacterium]